MDKYLERIIRTNDITCIFLFGSQATHHATRESDTDIAYCAQRALTLKEIMDLKTALAKAYGFHEDTIDLINLAHASPLLQFEITTQGDVLWGNHDDVTTVKIKAWRQYLDTAKLRVMREKNLQKTYAP